MTALAPDSLLAHRATIPDPRGPTGAAPEAMAGLRSAAIGLLRLSGVTNVAAALRENVYHVRSLLAKLGILNL